MKIIRRMFAIAALLPLLLCAEAPPAGAAGEEPPPPPRRNPAERFHWRAFSRLGENERAELFKLQRTDPEKFREILRRKGEELRKQELARMAELRRLVAACKAASGPEQAELRKKIVAHLHADYLERLEENRRQLAEMKRHARKLEEELDKRAANIDGAVEAQTEAILTGKELPPAFPPPPEGKGRK